MTRFVSDNVAGAHPAILEALVAASADVALPYGDDALSMRLDRIFSDLFECQTAVVPCVSGTAANALALSLLAGPTDAVCAHAGSHVYGDECNAPEFFTGGARLTPVAGDGGKLTPAALEDAVSRKGDRHAAQPRALSLAQPTETGLVYRPNELAALGDFATHHGLALHMDGARFANAVVALGCTPAETTWKAGIDILSFGATKNGCLAAEAVVFFDPDLAAAARFRAKRAGQMLSKMRFVSAQLISYLEGGRWLSCAGDANDAAQRLRKGLERLFLGSVQADCLVNMVFAKLPRDARQRLENHGMAGYCDSDGIMRLCTAWDTTDRDIETFLACAAGECEKSGSLA